MHGQFVWYELTTPDTDAAQKFYPSFTGWGTQAFDNDYTMWTTGGVPFAGIFRLTPEMRAQGVPPNWMPYIATNDVDEKARLATSLGGTVIVPPADIPGTGRYAVVQDPQSAVFGIYSSNTGQGGWDGTPVVGRFSWHELMSTDFRAAFAFYQRLFGWEKVNEMDMGGGLTYLTFGKGQKMYGGMYNRTPDMGSMRPFWLCYIHVKDVPKAVDTASKRGAMVVRPPMPIPGGVIAVLGDPQGAGFAVHHVGAATASPAAKSAAAGSPRKPKKAARKAAKKAAKKARPRRAAARKGGSRATAKRRPAKKAAKRRTARRKTARPARRSAAKKTRRRAAKAKRRR